MTKPDDGSAKLRRAVREAGKPAKKPRKHRRTGKPRGRPQKPIDLDILNGLAEINASREEMAAVLGVNPSTLNRRNYATLIEKGRALYRISIRRNQKKKADLLDTTMNIWLGKQDLGQVDKVEQMSKADVKHTYVIEFDEPGNLRDRRPKKVEDDEEEDDDAA